MAVGDVSDSQYPIVESCCFRDRQCPPGPPPPPGRLPPLEVYCVRLTAFPPDTVAPIMDAPPKYSVPPFAETPDFKEVVPDVDTISVLPPLSGVLNTMATSFPL